jgi:heme A synthase
LNKNRSILRFSWLVIAFNLAVILWGAYVRATGSGAGCGRHWPLCDGEILPQAPAVETLIEFSHRISSGIAFLLVFVLLIIVWRNFERGHPARLGAVLSIVFITTEALIGAGLVLFELVAENESIARGYSISVHLINTLILLGSLTLTSLWISGRERISLRVPGRGKWLVGIGLVGVLLIGVSGAIAALGDTLFPPQSVAEGFAADFLPTAHVFIRLRILHPTIAAIMGAYLFYLTLRDDKDGFAQGLEWTVGALRVLVVAQLVAGVVNVFLLAPVWMQLVHLLLADMVWIALVVFSFCVLSVPQKTD